ncbi:MAG: endonuclease III [Deltaproteobacteria bacterium]|nr:endonuclease III [Deltaproteobacteria bacterium]MBW2123892.1 endonuclease III [Deltaproteobacteria bacterium]
MKDRHIDEVVRILRQTVKPWEDPAVTQVARRRDPYQVLISCLLSLRTQDETTDRASKRLFALARRPEEMIRLSPEAIEKAIYPVGFYRNKARTILEISRTLIERYGGRVPDRIDEILRFKGVGRKTANLVITLGFGKPGICVDTHVHRITNRWGYVATKTPKETEFALREKLPKRYWIEINDMLVSFGQRICRPVSPRCSTCPLSGYCARVGVARSR